MKQEKVEIGVTPLVRARKALLISLYINKDTEEVREQPYGYLVEQLPRQRAGQCRGPEVLKKDRILHVRGLQLRVMD